MVSPFSGPNGIKLEFLVPLIKYGEQEKSSGFRLQKFGHSPMFLSCGGVGHRGGGSSTFVRYSKRELQFDEVGSSQHANFISSIGGGKAWQL